MKTLPPDSVRGAIRAYLSKMAPQFGDDILEVGCRAPSRAAWWTTCRDLRASDAKWLGLDMQAGAFVDVVCNAENLPEEWTNRFSAVVCSETLEHVRRPWLALREMRRVLRPGGVIVVTTLTAFPIHAYPDDFWRWTPSGLAAALDDAGFEHVKTESAGSVIFDLNDHGEPGRVQIACPIHVFGSATAPIC